MQVSHSGGLAGYVIAVVTPSESLPWLPGIRFGRLPKAGHGTPKSDQQHRLCRPLDFKHG
jgi:hypothetical protein